MSKICVTVRYDGGLISTMCFWRDSILKLEPFVNERDELDGSIIQVRLDGERKRLWIADAFFELEQRITGYDERHGRADPDEDDEAT